MTAVLPLLVVVAAGIAAAEPAPATYIPGARVREAFVKGAPLLEVADLKVHASRREAPGQAEVHARDTDVIYVLDGRATFVTGGTVVDGQTTAPDEIRGASIRDGVTRELAKDDVIVVPRGTPHQFLKVDAPFLYYVVKVTGETP
jgi:mannose-6-phosphate isomerase-like protein (cupin superfamily)